MEVTFSLLLVDQSYYSVFCQSSDSSELQNITNEDLKLMKWVDKHENCYEKILEKESELTENIFKPFQDKAIDNFIHEVSAELIYDDIKDDYVDHVNYSNALDRYPDKRVCTKCTKMCPKKDSNCMHCKYGEL